MRIRRCASRLLGSTPAQAPPRFELPPPSPPPAQESHAGCVPAASGACSSSLEHCELSLSPWDLMAQLHPSDPQEEELFFETYFVAVGWRASWLFAPSMPAGSIKEEEQEEVIADRVIFELRVASKRKTARKKNESKPKKVKVEESAEGGAPPVWICKKNDGKGWFCPRPVSQPDSLCPYHSDQKPPSKPRKRAAAYAGEGFYYYAGFGPSRSKRHRISSSIDAVPEPPPAVQKEEAVAVPLEEKHIDSTVGQAQADGADHQAPPPVQVDEPMSDGTAGIAGCDEESSSDDAVEPWDIKRKSPLKKRWRKPVKARSLKSLMC